MSGSRAGRRLPVPRSRQGPEHLEPNGSAKARNWTLVIVAVLGLLGGTFFWLDSSFDELDRRMDTFAERLAGIEARLDILLSDRSGRPAD